MERITCVQCKQDIAYLSEDGYYDELPKVICNLCMERFLLGLIPNEVIKTKEIIITEGLKKEFDTHK